MGDREARGDRNVGHRDVSAAKVAERRRCAGGLARLHRGVLDVVVANAVLLQELAHYHKRRLLEELRRRLPGTTLTDLRFRAGVLNRD